MNRRNFIRNGLIGVTAVAGGRMFTERNIFKRAGD